nr:hypothetical protein [Kribbella kalugense]
MLIDVLREHRGKPLSDARRYVYRDLGNQDLSHGMDGLPSAEREAVRDLMCFYDILGVMVAYDAIDADPVIGNLGGTVVDMWSALAPLVASERRLREVSDPERWHWYFEYLAALVETHPPRQATVRLRPAGSLRREVRAK